MGFLRRVSRQPEEKPRQLSPQKPKKGKCKIKWKTGKDGSETFESTPECTESNIQRAMQMRESRRANMSGGLGDNRSEDD